MVSSDEPTDEEVRFPEPPEPFRPNTWILSPESEEDEYLYRVYATKRTVVTFNPAGEPNSCRFSPFGDPIVPVLYAGQSRESAVCESILHNVLAGDEVRRDEYLGKALGRFRLTRRLRLAEFMNEGLTKLGVRANELTDTYASQYPRTIRWAAAAHAAGFDGIVWMSSKRTGDRAYILFGNKVTGDDLESDEDYGLSFDKPDGFNWLSNYAGSMDIEVAPPAVPIL